jgi:D-alanine-D-alanine ligase
MIHTCFALVMDGRVATADDAAQLAAFLAPDTGAYVTGQAINLAGARSCTNVAHRAPGTLAGRRRPDAPRGPRRPGRTGGGRGRRLKVAVLLADLNAPDRGRGDENVLYEGAQEADAALMSALAAAGFEAWRVPVDVVNVDEVIGTLECDVAFNLCEGSGPRGDGLPGVEVVEALERRRIPYTGARAEFYRLGCSKIAMKERFLCAGLATPAYQVFHSPGDPLDPELARRFPLIVKISDSGGSAGIHLRSVVRDPAELRAQLTEVVGTYGHALVEEYIDGREVTVALLGQGRGLRVFAPLELRFSPVFPAERHIQTFELKWDRTSPMYAGFEWLCPAPLESGQRRRVLSAARAAYRAVRGSGYGRVDFRLRGETPFVLEVNANPSLDWSEHDEYARAEYPIVAAAAGWSYPRLLQEIVRQALRLATASRRPRRRR